MDFSTGTGIQSVHSDTRCYCIFLDRIGDRLHYHPHLGIRSSSRFSPALDLILHFVKCGIPACPTFQIVERGIPGGATGNWERLARRESAAKKLWRSR